MKTVREEATRMNTMPNEIKPCEKCGGEAEIIAFDRKAFGVWRIYFFYAKCRLCGNRTPVFTDEIDAIKAWNRRAGEEDKHETD